jgi:hypothetical protein
MSEEVKPLSLDEQLAAWLKERNAGMFITAKGPNSGTPVPISDFLRKKEFRIPADWTLTVTVVEVKR